MTQEMLAMRHETEDRRQVTRQEKEDRRKVTRQETGDRRYRRQATEEGRREIIL